MRPVHDRPMTVTLDLTAEADSFLGGRNRLLSFHHKET